MPHDSRGSLMHVMADVVRHPVSHLFRKWNYKSAVTSSLMRGALFFFANVSSGWLSATSAWVTEFAFRFATAGFYGALTQAFRRVEPERTGTIAAMVILPLIAHCLELVVHWWRGTPNLWLSIGLSVCLTAFSTSFNLFAMRRGILIVGEVGHRSLISDLKAMPATVAAFVRALICELRAIVVPNASPMDLRP